VNLAKKICTKHVRVFTKTRLTDRQHSTVCHRKKLLKGCPKKRDVLERFNMHAVIVFVIVERREVFFQEYFLDSL